MKSHIQIDARNLALARHIVARIDLDSAHKGVDKARQTCNHWLDILPDVQHHCVNEWVEILKQQWKNIRSILLDPSEKATQLRQNNPFCGILSNRERWQIFKEYSDNDS